MRELRMGNTVPGEEVCICRTLTGSTINAGSQNGEYGAWRGSVKYSHLSPAARITISKNTAIDMI
jgi:hypothetical protein